MENQPDPHREQSLEEAQHILQIFQKNSSSINMTPDLMNDMEKVNATVANFKEKTEQILNTIDQRLQNFSFPFNEEGKSEIYQKLSEQSKNIAMNVRSLQLALSNTKRKKRGSSSPMQERERRQMKERKKMFKTIGGDQKWIPF